MATTTASVPETSQETEYEMEISMASDMVMNLRPQALHTDQLLLTPPLLNRVLDQFQQMRSIISSFLGARQDTAPSPRQLFCNYLYSEIEHLEELDFFTFRNETVKLLSGIQYKAEESKRQVTISQ